MQEDKKLQSLLTTYAVQEPSAGFEDKVMQLVAASKKIHATSLISGLLKRVLLVIFITVAAVLLIISLFIKYEALPVHISIPVPTNVYVQLFSFFLAFWTVMFINIWWNKKNIRQMV